MCSGVAAHISIRHFAVRNSYFNGQLCVFACRFVMLEISRVLYNVLPSYFMIYYIIAHCIITFWNMVRKLNGESLPRSLCDSQRLLSAAATHSQHRDRVVWINWQTVWTLHIPSICCFILHSISHVCSAHCHLNTVAKSIAIPTSTFGLFIFKCHAAFLFIRPPSEQPYAFPIDNFNHLSMRLTPSAARKHALNTYRFPNVEHTVREKQKYWRFIIIAQHDTRKQTAECGMMRTAASQ